MRKPLKYALINSAIAGGLIFLGAFTDGSISLAAIIAAVAAAGIAFLTNMKTFISNVKNKKGTVSPGVFTFYGA